jgi:small subunit ribosomal protein S4
VLVNGATVDIPSFTISAHDEVRMAPGSGDLVPVRAALEGAARGAPVGWLAVDTEHAVGKVTELPTRDAIPVAAQEQLIVELYSK